MKSTDDAQNPTTNAEALKDVGDLIQTMFADGQRPSPYFRAYSMVICEAGHHLTGEGPAPTECPVCKGGTSVISPHIGTL